MHLVKNQINFRSKYLWNLIGQRPTNFFCRKRGVNQVMTRHKIATQSDQKSLKMGVITVEAPYHAQVWEYPPGVKTDLLYAVHDLNISFLPWALPLMLIAEYCLTVCYYCPFIVHMGSFCNVEFRKFLLYASQLKIHMDVILHDGYLKQAIDIVRAPH